MPFEKGNSGNPHGTKRARQFYNMLNVALKEKPDALRRIAGKLVSEAEKGEQWAIKELADRLDGKAAQEIIAEVEQTQKWIGPPPKTAEEWQAEYGDDAD